MKKKIIVLIVIIICNVILFGRDFEIRENQRERLLKNFSHFEKVTNKRCWSSVVLYNKEIGEKIGKNTGFDLSGMNVSEYTYAKVKISKGDKYRKIFQRSTDDGVTCEFFIEGINDKPTYSKFEFNGEPGDLLIIPGDGNLYLKETRHIKSTKIHVNFQKKERGEKYLKFKSGYGNFDRVVRLRVEKGKLIRVKEAHYITGWWNIMTDVKMYGSEGMKEMVGELRKGDKVELILQWGDEDKVFIRNELDQVGWIMLYNDGKRVYHKYDMTYNEQKRNVKWGIEKKRKEYEEYLKEYWNE